MPTSTGTKSRGLTDTKTDPRYTSVTSNQTAATTDVKASVVAFLKKETDATTLLEGGYWGVVSTAIKCKSEHHLSEQEVKQLYREELIKLYSTAEEAVAKAYHFNRAIRVGFTKSSEEIEIDRKSKTFQKVYAECAKKQLTSKGHTVINNVRDNDDNKKPKEKIAKPTISTELTGKGLLDMVEELVREQTLKTQTVVRAVTTFCAGDSEKSKDLVYTLLEDDDSICEAAANYFRENPFEQR